jgi:hypothetical protein
MDYDTVQSGYQGFIAHTASSIRVEVVLWQTDIQLDTTPSQNQEVTKTTQSLGYKSFAVLGDEHKL